MTFKHFISAFSSFHLAIFAMVFVCSSSDAQDMRVFYNIDSGNVQIEVINNAIALFSLETRDNTNADNTGFLDFMSVNSPAGLGAPAEANRDKLVWNTSPSTPFAVGRYDIGNVLDSGIDFRNASTNASSEAFDSGGSQFGIAALGYTVTSNSPATQPIETVSNAVPEPTTLPLLVMASSFLLNRRRRS